MFTCTSCPCPRWSLTEEFSRIEIMRLLKTNWVLFGVAGLLVVGFVLRVYRLDELPGVMHRDEVSIAYNAYSLWQTGADEWGEAWPLTFRAFSDYKLPGAVYTTLPGVAWFGLNPFGARLPQALVGVLTIPVAYWLVRVLFDSRRLGLLVALLLTSAFWHVAGSRNIYEPVMALPLALLSYGTLYLSKNDGRNLILSLGLFGLSVWFYNTAVVVYPLLFIGWWWYLQRRGVDRSRRAWVVGLIAMVVIGLGSLLLQGGLVESRSRTSLWGAQELIDVHQSRLHRFWSAGVPLYPMFTVWERGFQLGHQMVGNYVASLNPDFYFFTGGNNVWHNLSNISFGDSNLALIPFVFLGLVYLWRERHSPGAFFGLLWLVVAPIPSALTVDVPNVNRLLEVHFLLLLFAGVGFFQAPALMQARLARWLRVGGVVVFTVVLVEFVLRYFLVFNTTMANAWYPEVPELMHTVQAVQGEYDAVYVGTEIPMAYVYYLFYTHYQPTQLHAYDTSRQGRFVHENRVENVVFGGMPVDRLDSGRYLIVESVEHERLEGVEVFEVSDWEDRPVWVGKKIVVE